MPRSRACGPRATTGRKRPARSSGSTLARRRSRARRGRSSSPTHTSRSDGATARARASRRCSQRTWSVARPRRTWSAACLELAIAAAPRDATLRLDLAALLEQLGEPGRVADVLTEHAAVAYGERRPKERALLHHRIARALLAAERPSDALEQLKHAAK